MGLLQDQPLRMLKEKHALNALAQTETWFIPANWTQTDDGNLALNFQLSLLNLDFAGVLVYPSLFPGTPAYIRPQKYGEEWSAHQYGGAGVLCLEYGPDNWHDGVTGTDLVRSAYQLLAHEIVAVVLETSPATPSRHQQNIGQILRSENKRFIITRELRNVLNAMPDGACQPIHTCITFSGGTSTTIVTQFGDGDDNRIKDVPDGVEKEFFERQGWAVCDQRLIGMPAASTITELCTTLEKIGRWPWDGLLADTHKTLLLLPPGGEPRTFTIYGGEKPTIWECKAVAFDCDDAQRLPNQFSSIGKEWVAIVGIGSVGSKIAVSLARSGVRNFVLVDDDILAPQNLVRHQLTWRSVGFHKAEGVAAISPERHQTSSRVTR